MGGYYQHHSFDEFEDSEYAFQFKLKFMIFRGYARKGGKKKNFGGGCSDDL